MSAIPLILYTPMSITEIRFLRGEPRRFELPDTDIDAFSEKLFASLNVDNRVSLYVSYLFDNGAEETRIINRQG